MVITADLDLRPVARSDAGELIQANIESRSYHAPWLKPFTDQPGFDAWYARRITGPNVSLVARDRTSGKIAGVLTLSEIVAGLFQSAYLAYYGMAAFAGRGLMTCAVRETARYAFRELGLHRIEANIQPGNTRSITLVRRVGFRKEGFSPEYLLIDDVWSDCERWALLARELDGDTSALPQP